MSGKAATVDDWQAREHLAVRGAETERSSNCGRGGFEDGGRPAEVRGAGLRGGKRENFFETRAFDESAFVPKPVSRFRRFRSSRGETVETGRPPVERRRSREPSSRTRRRETRGSRSFEERSEGNGTFEDAGHRSTTFVVLSFLKMRSIFFANDLYLGMLDFYGEFYRSA